MRKLFGSLCVLSFLLAPSAWADDASRCADALKHTAQISAKQPIEVDSATNTTAAFASCAAKTLVVKRQIALKHARMEDDFKDFLSKQISDHACADKVERGLVNSGWSVRYENVFNDGPVVKINVACPEAK